MLNSLYSGSNFWFWMLPGVLLTLFAQFRLRSKFNKYKQQSNAAQMSGRDVARQILDSEGLNKIPVNRINGSLTDHYDPRKKTVNLSKPIYAPQTIASMAVGAHETGHAIQDKDGYFFMRLRSVIVPLASIGTNLGYILVVLGILIHATGMAKLGVLLFAMSTLFALITLPVEFNASKRAKKKLDELGLVRDDEAEAVKKMLDAAAFTYVAAFAVSAIQLLFWSKTVKGATNETEAASSGRMATPSSNTRSSSKSSSTSTPTFGSKSSSTSTPTFSSKSSSGSNSKSSNTEANTGGVTIQRSDDPDSGLDTRTKRRR